MDLIFLTQVNGNVAFGLLLSKPKFLQLRQWQMTTNQTELTTLIKGCFDIDSDVVPVDKIIGLSKTCLRRPASVSDVIRLVIQNDDLDLIFVFDSDVGKKTICVWDLRKMNAALRDNERTVPPPLGSALTANAAANSSFTTQ